MRHFGGGLLKSETFVITLGQTAIAVKPRAISETLMRHLFLDLRPFIQSAIDTCEPQVTLEIQPFEVFHATWSRAIERGEWSRADVRRSSDPAYDLQGFMTFHHGWRFLLLPEFDSAIRWRLTQRKIDVYVSPASRIFLREFIFELFLRCGLGSTMLAFHAAAAVKDGQAVLIFGHKGAGKTTMVLEMAARHGFRIISTDRLFVSGREDVLHAYGWPDDPNLGLGTIQLYPKLLSDLPAASLARLGGVLTKKLRISTQFLEETLGIRSELGPCRIAAAVFASRMDQVDSQLRRVPSARTTYLDYIWISKDPSYGTWFDLFPPIQLFDTGDLREYMRSKLSKVPTFELEYGCELRPTILEELLCQRL
jgi:hypothetical protein